jgi:hypothetical protein
VILALLAVCGFALQTRAYAESNESPDVLVNTQAAVQLQLDAFAKEKSNYDHLLAAQKLSASLNPRGGKATLSKLDEDCLRLQLKVLLALSEARDRHYDRKAPANRVAINIMPPVSNANELRISGMDPTAIKDPTARKQYNEAIAENLQRLEKSNREHALSRGMDYALIHIWIFVQRGFRQDSPAQKRAIEIVHETIQDKELLERFNSKTRPGITR